MSRFTRLERRLFLTAGAALGATALCGSAARALTPRPVYLNVELIAVDNHPVSGEQELYSLLPERNAFEQRLIDHIQHGIGSIPVTQRNQALFDRSIIDRVLFATVRTDLASSPFSGAANEMVGVFVSASPAATVRGRARRVYVRTNADDYLWLRQE